MRKYLSLFIATAVLLTGCGKRNDTSKSSTETTSTTTTTSTTSSSLPQDIVPENTFEQKSATELAAYKSKIIKELDNSVPYSKITVDNKVSGVYLCVEIEGTKNITNFGNYIYEIRNAFEVVFEHEQTAGVDVLLMNGNDTYIKYYDIGEHGKTGVFCYVYDYRDGGIKSTRIETIDDLCSLFPALRQYIGKSDVDPNKLAVYEEVMAVLNEQYDRPEDEILEELAPKYGMSASDLKQLLRDVMSEIY